MQDAGSNSTQTLGQRAFGDFSWPEGEVPAVLAGDPIPLKIGVRDDLEAMLPESEHEALRTSLSRWTRGFPYHYAVMQPNSKRHDLQARPVEDVSNKEREHAKAAIEAKQLSRARKQYAQLISALDAIDTMFKAPSAESLAAAKKASATIRSVLTDKP